MTKRSNWVPGIRLAVGAICAGAAFSTAQAAEPLNYVLRVGAAYSDNVFRVAPTGRVEDALSLMTGASIFGTKDEGRLRYDIAASLEHYEFLTSNAPGTTFGNGYGRATYDIVEEFFSWNANAAYEQLRGDSFRPIAPGNAESTISWSTGPTFRVRLGDVTRVDLDGTYARQDYSSRPFDNETLGGRVQLVRQATRRTLIGVGYSYDSFSYIGGLGASRGLDFERQETFARFDARGARTTLEAQAGVSKVKGANIDDSSPMARLRASRKLSPSITGFVGLVREYPTSLATPMPRDELLLSGLDDSALLTSTPRIMTTGEAGLRYERERLTTALTYYTRNEKSLVPNIGSRKSQELRLDANRRFTQTTSGSVFVGYAKEDYTLFTRQARDKSIGAGYVRDFGRSLGLEARVEYHDRSGLLAVDTFREFSGGVFLRYTNHGDRRDRL